MKAENAVIEFYVSLVTYTVMHMIFVISSDFVEAFSIPPLNIGIYVDKLAAIRALLMVIADIIEWQATDGDFNMQSALKNGNISKRRIGSLLSFFAMLVCRSVYLWIVYKSDNKSLSVFITLCIEGFWFGTFQMGFFAIGPEYNAFTSLGIHTMGNFIFFLQLILQHRAKSKPYINCLYRVRVHGWTCLITSIIALCLWIYFCIYVTASGEDAPSEWPNEYDVWSPFLLFIVGAFAEDFSVPGVLPFALLDPEKANLVNYLTPVFFMTGAILTVLFNDGTKVLNLENTPSFKDWSASTNAKKTGNHSGMYWHSLWALNIPKYIAFFISMWSIHGTYDSLRCIIQSRWRVLVLTMTVVVPRAWLETAGYVGVANYAIGRSDLFLGGLAGGLKTGGVTNDNYQTDGIKDAINNSGSNKNKQVKDAIADLVQQVLGLTVTGGDNKEITATNDGTNQKVTVTIQDSSTSSNKVEGGKENVLKENNKVTITIKVEGTHSGLSGKTTEANKIADKIWKAAEKAKDHANASIDASRDFSAFQYIAFHDILAMFCRFVYGKFAVGYNSTTIKFRYTVYEL